MTDQRRAINRRAFLGGAGATGLTTATFAGTGSPAVAEPSDAATNVQPTTVAHAPFSTSSEELSRLANVFWTVYGVAESDSSAPGALWGANSAWTEWDAMQFCWTAHGGYRDIAMETLLSLPINGSNGVTGNQPTGFPWSWADRETWPDDNDAHGGVPSYHFDQVPRFVNATYAYYCWTRDKEFLARALPRAELIMEEYALPVLGLASGLLTIPDETNDGVSNHSRASTYMDQIRSGYQDAWINAATYTALRAMAELEDVVGNAEKAARYNKLAKAFPALYDQAFWLDDVGRYAGWRDVTGERHDSGYQHVNLEALGRGLGEVEKADRIFAGLAAAAAPIEYGPHTGSTDAYHNVVAARTTTLVPPPEDLDGWSDPPQGPKPYGDTVQSGGTVMWLNYHDVMARLRYQDADRAFERLRAMLERVGEDTHLLTFDVPSRLYNDFGESLVQVGTNHPFPESGIAVLPLLEGFVGVRATTRGLEVTPNLPSALLSVGVSDLDYAGRRLAVSVTSADVVAESEDGPADLAPGTVVVREFTAERSFNGAQARVSATHGGWTILGLERWSGSAWERVATRRHEEVGTRPTWLPLAFERREPGRYRLIIERPGSDGPLPHPEGEGGGGVRLWAHRILDAPQRAAAFTAAEGAIVLRACADRFVVQLDDPVDGPVQVTLQHHLAGRWVDISGQVVQSAAGEPIVFATSDQKPGRYRVVATYDGRSVRPRVTAVEQAVYRVESAELDVTAEVPAGERYVLAKPPNR